MVVGTLLGEIIDIDDNLFKQWSGPAAVASQRREDVLTLRTGDALTATGCL